MVIIFMNRKTRLLNHLFESKYTDLIYIILIAVGYSVAFWCLLWNVKFGLLNFVKQWSL